MSDIPICTANEIALGEAIALMEKYKAKAAHAERLAEALEPFARVVLDPEIPDGDDMMEHLNVGHFRAAVEAWVDYRKTVTDSIATGGNDAER